MRSLIMFLLLGSLQLASGLVPAEAQDEPTETALRDEEAGGPSAYLLAEDLKDRQVVNAIGEEVGEVSNLIIRGDRITHAIISTGGFLGIGGSDVVVPFGVLTLQDDHVTIDTIASADQIEELTLFDPAEFGLAE